MNRETNDEEEKRFGLAGKKRREKRDGKRVGRKGGGDKKREKIVREEKRMIRRAMRMNRKLSAHRAQMRNKTIPM